MLNQIKLSHNLGHTSPGDKILGCRVIDSGIRSSTKLDKSRLPLSMDEYTQSINNADDLRVIAEKGTTDDTNNMHNSLQIMMGFTDLLKAYVTIEARKNTDPVALAESCGFKVVVMPGSKALTDMSLSALGDGTVEVSVPRTKGIVSFIYQYSLDAGNTWILLEYSKLATLQLKGQTPGATIHFRFAGVGKTAESFSQPKSIMVI